MLFFTIATLSLGSAVQGWDNTGVNVCPLQTMALALKLINAVTRGPICRTRRWGTLGFNGDVSANSTPAGLRYC